VSKCGGVTPVGSLGAGLPAGTSFIELILVLGIVSLVAAMSAPLLAGAADAGRAREAAQFVASQCRGARMDAIARNTTSSLVFDVVRGQWRFRRCVDGNGNGMRRAEITSGRDRCASSAEVGELFSGVHVGVPSGLPDPDGGPATSGAVRFGSSDIASFSPLGTASAGTVYVRSDRGAQYAVRVAGATGRVRVLHYDAAMHRWSEI
jgi:type II secretory pathway pseudopilin PulG